MKDIREMIAAFRGARDQMQEQLDFMRRPDTHFHAMGNRDIKPEWIATLERRITELDAILADAERQLAPA